MMLTVVSVFTLCWLPLNTLIVVGDEYDAIWQFTHIQYVWFICHWLAMSSASYNPVIYCWMNSKYREGFLYVFHRLLCYPVKDTSLQRNGFSRGTNTTMYTSIRSSGTHRGSQSSSHRGSLVKGYKHHHRTDSGTDVIQIDDNLLAGHGGPYKKNCVSKV